jgi:hypothetical protein
MMQRRADRLLSASDKENWYDLLTALVEIPVKW